jgi:hypothetical protein
MYEVAWFLIYTYGCNEREYERAHICTHGQVSDPYQITDQIILFF